MHVFGYQPVKANGNKSEAVMDHEKESNKTIIECVSTLHRRYTTRKKLPCDTQLVASDSLCITRQFFSRGVTWM